jgi:hypothetical protein
MIWNTMKATRLDLVRRGLALSGRHLSTKAFGSPSLSAWLAVLLASSCAGRDREEEVPDTLVAVARVPFTVPVHDGAMRVAISEDQTTLDLRLVAKKLPEHKRRIVQGALVSMTDTPVRCDHISYVLELAEELQAGDTLDVEVDPRAQTHRVADTLSALSLCSKFQEYRIVLHGSNGIGTLPIAWTAWPRCPVDPDTRSCAVPHLRLSEHGLQIEISAAPMPTEPRCGTGVRRFRPLDESWLSESLPAWHDSVLVFEDRECPSIPKSVAEPLVRLAELLEEARRIGPGCEAVVLDVDGSIEWREVADVLAILKIEAAYEFVRLEISEHAEPPNCTRSMRTKTLPTG